MGFVDSRNNKATWVDFISIVVNTIITSHVLVQLQRHTDVADLHSLKVALDDNIT